MLQAIPLERGGEVLFEFDEVEPPRHLGEGVPERAVQSFEEIFRTARPVIEGIVDGLGNLDLDEVSVKFSLKITGEGKILFIAKGKVEGGIELGLTWKPRSSQ
jgi:hypothetical protein